MIVERGKDGNLYAVFNGSSVVLTTHKQNEGCLEFGCAVHNPSASVMSDFKMNWREDRGMMERICSHGVGHPDIDQVKFWIRALDWKDAWAEMVHGCDGCCHTIEEEV